MLVLGKQRRSKTFTGKNELIGRPAKFDWTAAEPLKLREVRVAHVGQRYFGWVNIRAGDLPQTIDDNRDRELGVLRGLEPGTPTSRSSTTRSWDRRVSCTRMASFTIRQ